MTGRCCVAVAFGLVAAAMALDVQAQELPQFRDPRTGRMWTPEIVEPSSAPVQPVVPSDKAFDPRDQTARVQGLTVQHPRATLMGAVPISAGPGVPLLTLDVPLLQVVPGRYWLSVLYLTNNSGGTIDAVVGCHFLNGSRRVQDTRIVVPPAGPGERLGIAVRGPRYDLFVDRVSCEVISPT